MLNKIFLVFIAVWSSVLLFACNQKDDKKNSENFEIAATDPRVTHQNPVWLSAEGQTISTHDSVPSGKYKVLGFLNYESVKLEKIDGVWTLNANLNLRSDSSEIIWNKKIQAQPSQNSFEEQWHVISDEPISVWGMCLDKDSKDFCQSVVIDIFVNHGDRVHALQLIAETNGAREFQFEESEKSKLAEQAKAELSVQEEVEGVDPEEYKSVYVGHIFETGGLSKATDQVIGLPNRGKLQNSSSLKDAILGVEEAVAFVHPERKRFFGSYEMMGILKTLAVNSKAYPRQAKLWVGDISMKTGGLIRDSRHVSHQNGLDVDIGYPLKRDQVGSFINVVSRGGLASDFQMNETWGAFKTTWDLGVTDRIFIGGTIKRAVCKYAKSVKEYEKYSQLLRHLRPTPGHDNHYHLRIKCTPNQPRCRMMGPPPTGTGC